MGKDCTGLNLGTMYCLSTLKIGIFAPSENDVSPSPTSTKAPFGSGTPTPIQVGHRVRKSISLLANNVTEWHSRWLHQILQGDFRRRLLGHLQRKLDCTDGFLRLESRSRIRLPKLVARLLRVCGTGPSHVVRSGNQDIDRTTAVFVECIKRPVRLPGHAHANFNEFAPASTGSNASGYTFQLQQVGVAENGHLLLRHGGCGRHLVGSSLLIEPSFEWRLQWSLAELRVLYCCSVKSW